MNTGGEILADVASHESFSRVLALDLVMNGQLLNVALSEQHFISFKKKSSKHLTC